MPGMGGGGSSGYTNMPSWGWSSQTTAPTAGALSAYDQALRGAQSLANRPFTPYTGQLVAGLTPQQRRALGQIKGAQNYQNMMNSAAANSIGNANTSAQRANIYGRNAAQASKAALQLARNGYQTAKEGFGIAQQGLPYAQQGFDLGKQGFQLGQNAYDYGKGWADTLNAQNWGNTIAGYQNPYVNSVVTATQKNINETNAQQQQALTSKMIMSGGMGGDRAGVASAELQRQQNLASQQTIAQLYDQAYNQAAENARGAAGIGEQAAGLGINAGQLGISAGGLGEQTAAAYNNVGQTGVSAGNTGVAAGGVGMQRANTLLGVGQLQDSLAGMFNNQANIEGQLGATATNSNLATANAMNNWGLMSQNTNQNNLNAQYLQFLRAQQYPYANLAFLAGIGQGVGPLMGGTQNGQYAGYQPYKQNGSAGSSILGLGTSLLGAGLSAFGAKRGGRIGKDLGGSISSDEQGVGGAIPKIAGAIEMGLPGQFRSPDIPEIQVHPSQPLPFGEIHKPGGGDTGGGESQQPDFGGLGKELGRGIGLLKDSSLFSGGDQTPTVPADTGGVNAFGLYSRGGRAHYAYGGGDELDDSEAPADLGRPIQLAKNTLSDADRDLAIRTIYGEGGHESDLGKAAIAHVIQNRLNSGQWGKTLHDVIMAPKQFSLWNRGDPAGDVARRLPADSPAYRTIGDIVDKVNSGEIPDPTGGAKNYYNPHAARPAWGDKLAQQGEVTIGNHRFVGGPGAKSQEPIRVAANDTPTPSTTATDAPTDINGVVHKLAQRMLETYGKPSTTLGATPVPQRSKWGNIGDALMTAGFGMMAGRSPIAMQNIGAGALAGLQQYRHATGADESPGEAEMRQLQMENLRTQMNQRNSLIDTQRLNVLLPLLKYEQQRAALERSNRILTGQPEAAPPPALTAPTLTGPAPIAGAAPKAAEIPPPGGEAGAPMELPGAPKEGTPPAPEPQPNVAKPAPAKPQEGMRPAGFDPTEGLPEGDAKFLQNAPEWKKSVTYEQGLMDEAKKRRSAATPLMNDPETRSQGVEMIKEADALEQRAQTARAERQQMLKGPILWANPDNPKDIRYRKVPSFEQAENESEAAKLRAQTPEMVERERQGVVARQQAEEPYKLAEENRKVKQAQGVTAQTAMKMAGQMQQLRDAYFDQKTGQPRVGGGPGVLNALWRDTAKVLSGVPGFSPEVIKQMTGTDPNNLQQVQAFANLLGAEMARLNLPGQRIAQQEFMRLSSMGPGEHMSPEVMRTLIDNVFLPAAHREVEKYESIRKADPHKDDFNDIMFDVDKKYMDTPPGTPNAAAPSAAPRALPQVGETRNGYRFKGGNPANKASWEKING